MKKIITLFFLFSAMCGFAFAKTPLPELDKAKEIKLLESTREDVKKILADYEHDDSDDEDYKQYFSTKNAEIEVTFSSGDCSENFSYWNVSEWVATKIKITTEDTIKSKDFNFSNFKKEIPDEESPEFYNYHDEKSGIVFEIDEDEIQKIILYPPKSKNSFLCNNEKTLEVYSNQKRIVDLILEEPACILINHFANVTNLNLSAGEITVGCSNSATNKKCTNSKTKISVTTEAIDPENDVLTYNYNFSAGKIIGQGANVVWDLSDVKPGIYTITAGVDDGCGICGTTVTKTVVVKECPDCSIK